MTTPTMKTLHLTFPDQWSLVPCGPTAGDEAAGLVAALADLGPEVQAAMARYLDALIPGLRALGLSGLASLFLAADGSTSMVQAVCAIGTITREEGQDHPAGDVLVVVAEGGPHPGLDRSTSAVALPVGRAVKSSAVRFAEELVDADGIAPYVGEIRYAFEIGEDLIGVLHFETQTLVYLDDVERLGDAIAATVQLS